MGTSGNVDLTLTVWRFYNILFMYVKRFNFICLCTQRKLGLRVGGTYFMK